MNHLKPIHIISFFVFISITIGVEKLPAADTLKVGIYQNEPKVYTDQNGEPAGIFVDLLNQMSKSEGWHIEYIETNWDNGLTLLKQGKIDLMPDVAFSMNRNQLFDFNTVPVIESWSQIYAPPESTIIKLSDLREKRIAVLKGSIQEHELQALMMDSVIHLQRFLQRLILMLFIWYKQTQPMPWFAIIFLAILIFNNMN